MPGLTELPLLFAQRAGGAQGGDGGLFQFLILIGPPILLYYLIFGRHHQQQERKRREMIDALKKNDRVLTQAGIYGTVGSVSPENDRVVLRVDDDRNVRLEFSKASIVRVLEAAEKDKEKDKAAELA